MNTDGLSFDVNTSILFTELPLLERFTAAADAGFTAVELWWPFDVPTPSDRQVERLVSAISDAGVRLVGLNFDAGDMAAGERGLLSQPDRSARFRANIDAAVEIAARCGCRALNALYGNRVDGVPEQHQDELAVENLALAARAAARAGAVVLVEVLNAKETPRYPIVSAARALRLVDAVRGALGPQHGDAVALLADAYHLAMGGADPVRVVDEHAPYIGHVQVADVPGRGEPGSGSLDFGALFDALRAVDYRGYVGCEYKPTVSSADSFGWLFGDHTPELSGGTA